MICKVCKRELPDRGYFRHFHVFPSGKGWGYKAVLYERKEAAVKCSCGVALFDCDAVEHSSMLGNPRPSAWRCPKCWKVKRISEKSTRKKEVQR